MRFFLTNPTHKKKPLLYLILIFVQAGIGIAALAWVLSGLDTAALTSALKSYPLWGVPVILSLVVLDYVVMSLRLRRLLPGLLRMCYRLL